MMRKNGLIFLLIGAILLSCCSCGPAAPKEIWDVQQYEEHEDIIRIRAEIFCEKQSHKGIIVGKGGEGLKRIGSYARQDLENLLGTKVYLTTWVKVKENWRDSDFLVRNFGYSE